MNVQHLKEMKRSERGFTIVELLIVIVIIGILAAIVIIAYNGITAKANTTKAQTNAESAQKVAEAFNADNGFYPALAASGTNSFGTYNGSTKLPSGLSIIPDAATSTVTASNGLTTVAYACDTSCTNSTGGRIAWWAFAAGSSGGVSYSAGVNYIYVGAGKAGDTFVYPAT